MMLSGEKPAGAIFALKNFGWTDKSEIEQTIKGDLQITGMKIL